MQWMNEPPQWSAENGVIAARAAGGTDFWRITHDNGQRDNGHFYFQRVTGDFVATVKVQGDYHALYDQAGLMVRLDERNWMKCGIEYVGDVQHVSAVVTRDFSDWSILPVAPSSALWLRVVRQGHTLEVSYALRQDADFTLLRQAYFPPTPEVQVGVMLCAPIGDGFDARFEGLAVTPGK